MLLEIGVAECWCAAGVELEVDAVDDVAVGFVGVEEAGPIAEVAGLFVEDDVSLFFAVESVDGDDSFGDFLPVGADVLDRCAADGARNAGEALDAGVVGGYGVLDEGVP